MLILHVIHRVRIPKFDDEDNEDDDEHERVRIKNRRAVYKAVLKEPNGKLSVSHISLEPRAQASIPLPVKKGEVLGFCWKEVMNVSLISISQK
jgi:hypothetical protein